VYDTKNGTNVPDDDTIYDKQDEIYEKIQSIYDMCKVMLANNSHERLTQKLSQEISQTMINEFTKLSIKIVKTSISEQTTTHTHTKITKYLDE
jgi:dUTPase